jgi:hypothetical protein
MRRRSEDCPSDLKLDRWLAGELTRDEQREVEAHVEGCDPCRHRHAELAESRRSFARDAPPFAAIERPAPSLSQPGQGPPPRSEPVTASRRELARRAAPRAHWLVGASALAAAAAIALAVGKPGPIPPSSSGDPAGSATRTKGGVASLGWVVRRGEHVFAGRSEETLRAGDAVRFTISAREPVYVAVLGLDAGGQLSVYHPDGERLSKVEAGRDQLLPTAIELDATPGAERLYGVFCPSAVLLSGVRAAIERAPDAPALPQGCSIERRTLNKESP